MSYNVPSNAEFLDRCAVCDYSKAYVPACGALQFYEDLQGRMFKDKQMLLLPACAALDFEGSTDKEPSHQKKPCIGWRDISNVPQEASV